MHDILVKPLPQKCRLTAVLDVSQIVWVRDHTDTFVVLPVWDSPWYASLENP
jgi:hypothetical protein